MLERYWKDIPFGAENAISRAALMKKWKKSDRDVRRIISDLRNNERFGDAVICSSSHRNEGYFKSTEPAHISQFIRETRNRAINTLKPAKNAARVLRILQSGEGETQGNILCCLRDMRKAAGISQVEFEQAMRQRYSEFNRVVLSAIENGMVIMTDEQTQYAAEVLHCDPGDIYPAGGF